MHVVSYLLDASSIERIDHIHPLGRPKIMVAIPSAYLHSFFPPLHLLLHHCSLVISCGRYRVSIELSSLFRESLPMTREQIRFGGLSFRTAKKSVDARLNVDVILMTTVYLFTTLPQNAGEV